jgi:hypothetical protein
MNGSPRTSLIIAHDDMLLCSSVSSSDIVSSESWNSVKDHIYQQTMRENGIQKQVDEKKELVTTYEMQKQKKKNK